MPIKRKFRLTLDLSVEIKTESEVPDAIPGIEHMHIYMKKFSENPEEIKDYYKRYLADLFGGDSDAVKKQMTVHLPAKKEKENLLTVAATCPPETAGHITNLIGLPEEEIKRMENEKKHQYWETNEEVFNYVMKCFRPPVIYRASFMELEENDEEKE